jgi:hypothetical protein
LMEAWGERNSKVGSGPTPGYHTSEGNNQRC